MKTLALFLACISISSFSYAQDAAKKPNPSISKNTIFVEFLGNAVLYSINYDRILVNKEKWKFTGRLGIGYGYNQDKISIFDIPSEFCFLIGKSKRFFETGLGVTYEGYTAPRGENVIGGEAKHYAYLFSRFGYRYQRPQGGFFFKAGLNVIFPLTENSKYLFLYSESIWVWGGVGIGYTFKQRKK